MRFWWFLTALVIGALLEGFIKCRSIRNHFPIKEKLLEHCTKIAHGCFISNNNGRNVTVYNAAVC